MTKKNYKLKSLWGKIQAGKFALTLVAAMISGVIWSQTANQYGFAASSGTYTNLSGGATAVAILGDDVHGPAAITLPFTFTFEGIGYTSVRVNSNGWLSFDGTANTATAANTRNNQAAAPAAMAPMVMPLWDDLDGASGTGFAGYETTGAPGSQVFTFEWRNWQWQWNATGTTCSFQVKLYETTNVIQFVYRDDGGAVTAGSATIGIHGATVANYLVLNNSGASPTASNSTYTTAIAAKAASGQVYTFTPPPPCSGTPTAGTPTTAVYNLCSGTSPGTLSYTGLTSGVTGLTYDWQSSPDGSSWSPTGTVTATYAAPNYTGVDQYYQLLVTCTNGGGVSPAPTPIYVTAPIAPTAQTSNIAITTASTTSLAVNWTNGTGLNGRVVYVNTVNSFVDPANGSSPVANTVYAGGQQCVFNGVGGAVTVTNLLPNTTYYFRAYEVTCTGAGTQYNTSTAANNPIGLNTADVLRYAITRTTGIGYSPVSGSAIQLHGGAFSVDDAMSVATNIGFNFTYGGVTRTQFRVSTNGFLSLNPAVGTSTFANGFAASAAHNTIIAPFWEDLLLPANLGTVKYELTGTPGSQVLTVQWADAEVFNYPGPSINFQVKLYEGTNVIEYVYGVMQGFDGLNPNNLANGYTFNYSCGMSNGSWTTALPGGAAAGEIIAQQRANAVSFTSQGSVTANEGVNKLSVMPECSSMLTFTPQLAVRPNDAAPGLPSAPSNDEWTSPVILTPLLSTPANFCGSYYSSAFATATPGVPAPIGATLADDDVWFQFTANATSTTITVRGAGGYDAAMQVMDEYATTVLASKNANAMGTNLTEVINSVDLTTAIGTIYLVRVYHANTAGTQATATATVSAGNITGFTIGVGGSGYITSNGGAGVTATPFVYITDATGSGAVARATVTAGAISAIAIQGAQNGTGYSGSPTVTIARPGYGTTGDFSIIINATPVAPSNDNICTATPLTPAASCVNTAGNTFNASASPEALCAGNPDDDVWYSWVCQGTETVSVTSAPSFNAHLQVYSSSDNTCTGTLTSLGCVNANGNGGSETFTGAFVVGNTYFARVYHSGTLAGSSGNFSICVTGVAPACPALTSPANAGTVGSSPVTLTWAAAAGASGYDVYLDQVDGLTSLVSANQPGLTYTGPVTAGAWFWRIVAKNATYGDATGCTVRTFSSAAPTCPVYTAPANAAVLYGPAGVTLSWNASVGGATGYNVYFGTNPVPSALVSSNQPGLTYNTGVLPNTGLTYYWRVDAIGTFGTSTGCAVGNFLTGAPAPPANDEPCGAIALAVNPFCNYATYTNAAASASAGIPAPGCASYSGGDVWFTITVPAGGEVDIDMNTGVMTDSGLAAYTVASGSCPSTLALSLLECNDDGSNNGLMSKLSLTGLTPGTTLYLRVWEYGNNNNGTFQICVAEPPVPATNDEVCTAIALTVNAGCTPITTHNFGSTATVGQPAPVCGTPSTDVWYTFTAPASGHVIITASQLPGGLTDGVMNLYSSTGSCPTPTLVSVDCDDDDGPGLLPLINQTGLTPGATYYLRFWGFAASQGFFGLCVANGATPPPANDEPATAVNVPVSGNAYPSCGALLGDITTATNSAQSTTYSGADVWYKFTAQSTGVRIVLTSGSMNGSITLLNNTFTEIQTENANFNTGGTEIMNFGGLIVNQVYYVGVGQDFGPGGGQFSLCVQSLSSSTCADGPGAYDLCTNFKPTYTGANSYQMSFTQTSPSAGPTTVASTPNQLALSSTSLNLRHTYGYNVTINAVYNLVNGVGTPEVITVNGVAPCAITIAAHPDLRTKVAQRCPATVFKGTTLQAKPFICAAINHTITFTEVGDCLGTNVGGIAFNTTTSGSSPTKKLSQVAGVQSGKWYEVTWTPNFFYGAGTPGTTDIIYVAASSGAEDVVSEFENNLDSEETVVSANIYPNPNNGDMVNINITDITSDNVFVRIFDNMGRVVYVNRFTVDGSLNTNVTFTRPLANGLYMVEFTADGETFTERMIVEK